MSFPPNLHKISGPPGTGKTTYLLDVVQDLLRQSVPPDQIAFTTFTRAGAYEARDRACARFKLSPQSFPFFRTLHSLCYQLLPPPGVMENADWFAIGKRLGLGFRLPWGRNWTNGDEFPLGSSRGDCLMATWMISRARRQTLKETFLQRSSGPMFQYPELEHFATSVTNYKTEFGKSDFADLLENYITKGPSIPAKYVIVDEFQDLSNLQSSVVEKMCSTADQVWIAGDDDQCIHEWNGANPKLMINIPSADYRVLPQSYRIPEPVQKFALGIIGQVKDRLVKEYAPRTGPGGVVRVSDMEQLPLKSGTWFLLARNTVYLKDYAEMCMRRGLLFTGYQKEMFNPKSIEAIRTWQKLQKLQTASVAEIKGMYLYMSRRDRIKNGFKQILNGVDEGLMLDHAELVKTYGMLARVTLPWTSALDQMPEMEKSYLIKVEQSGQLETQVRIEIGTIHSAKGREADHVALRPEMLRKTYDDYQRDPDQEHRVWYVGSTRSRETLYLITSTSDKSYPL